MTTLTKTPAAFRVAELPSLEELEARIQTDLEAFGIEYFLDLVEVCKAFGEKGRELTRSYRRVVEKVSDKTLVIQYSDKTTTHSIELGRSLTTYFLQVWWGQGYDEHAPAFYQPRMFEVINVVLRHDSEWMLEARSDHICPNRVVRGSWEPVANDLISRMKSMQGDRAREKSAYSAAKLAKVLYWGVEV